MKPITLRLGVMGAMSSLVALPMAGGAAAGAAPPAQSYAELLDPIPNASARLQTADLQESSSGAQLIPAAYYYRWVRERVYYHPRHYYRRYYRHYRRHYYYGYGYGYPYYVGPGPFWYYHYHHHHHHHHHHSFY